jgi:CHRD domain
MRRFISCFVAACAAAVLAAGAAPGKNGHGVLCVLHAKLAAKSETTGSTSTAKGHTQIKVRNDGTIEFKTQILNRDHETFVAGHIHQAPVGVAGPIVVPLFVSPTPSTNARHIRQSGIATPNAGTTGAAICQNPGAYYVNYHTTAFLGGAIRGQLR